MTYSDYLLYQEPQRWWKFTDSTAPLASFFIAIIVGAGTLFKLLEFLGYPVWLWLHQAFHMSGGALFYGGNTDASDDDMQCSGGMLGSLFSSSGMLLQKGVRSFTGALSGGPSNVPPGLGNISNSCYQNSVIQGLAALPSLRDYLSKITTDHPSFTSETMNGALHDMISQLNDQNNLGQAFWVRGKLKSMSTFQQQDAQEYYSKILDEMDMEVKKAASSRRRSSVSWLEAAKSLNGETMNVDGAQDEKQAENEKARLAAEQAKIEPNPLDGLIAQRVGCTSCGYSEGLSLINFNCITVSLGRNNSYDIRECLDEYTELEYIDGVECSKCTLLKLQKTLTPLANPGSAFETRLKAVTDMIDDEKFDDNALVKNLNIPKKNWVQSSKSKQIVVARAPKSLVLHVNRSIFDETTGAMYKNTASLAYPSTLDLGFWCLGNSPSGSRQPDISPEEWPRDPRRSMLPDLDIDTTSPSPFQYRLRAAVTHYGSHGNGHYVCYRPAARVALPTEGEDIEGEQKDLGEQWWRFSDDTVYAVSEEQAHQGNVFMLFYERIDESTTTSITQSVEAATEILSIPEDAPLPPLTMILNPVEYSLDDAVDVPLPEDEEALDLAPPASPQSQPSQTAPTTPVPEISVSTPSAYPTPPPKDILIEESQSQAEIPEDIEMSEAESEDAPSTQLTSDSEAEFQAPPTPKFTPISPQTMRTAGDAASRGQGKRQILPLVSAT